MLWTQGWINKQKQRLHIVDIYSYRLQTGLSTCEIEGRVSDSPTYQLLAGIIITHLQESLKSCTGVLRSLKQRFNTIFNIKKKMLLKKHFVHLIYVYHLFISFNYWLFFLRSFLYLLYKKMWNISFYISKNFPPGLFYYWTIMWCDSLSYHALVTMGQQEDQSQLPDPLILSTGYKLVNDWLSCVGKVSKLGLPQDQTVGIHLAEAHLKPCNTTQRYITQVIHLHCFTIED